MFYNYSELHSSRGLPSGGWGVWHPTLSLSSLVKVVFMSEKQVLSVILLEVVGKLSMPVILICFRFL